MTAFEIDGHLGDRLSALLDGELSPDEQTAARRHLTACADCRAELEEIGAARSRVRGLPAVDPPFGFYERVLSQGPSGPSERGIQGPSGPWERNMPQPSVPGRSPRRRLGMGFAALTATAAAALTVVTVGSPQNSPATPRVERLVEAHTTAGVTSDPVTQLVSVGVPATFAP